MLDPMAAQTGLQVASNGALTGRDAAMMREVAIERIDREARTARTDRVVDRGATRAARAGRCSRHCHAHAGRRPRAGARPLARRVARGAGGRASRPGCGRHRDRGHRVRGPRPTRERGVRRMRPRRDSHLERRATEVAADTVLSRAVLAELPGRLAGAQRVFADTGGLHGAALCRARDGALLAAREDVGRHNAVDKLVGWAIAERVDPAASCSCSAVARATSWCRRR